MQLAASIWRLMLQGSHPDCGVWLVCTNHYLLAIVHKLRTLWDASLYALAARLS
jgi:hypothetical protein